MGFSSPDPLLRIDGSAWRPLAYPRVNVVGVPVISATRELVTRDLLNCALAEYDRCHTAFFLNAHGCNLTFTDRAYVRALEGATWILNDGVGMDLAARLQGGSFAENLNGSDLIDEGEFLHHCARAGIRIFLLGARQDVLDLAAQRYQELFPGLGIAGTHHGYFDHQDEMCSLAVVDEINASGAEVLLVGLGNPLQEHWLDRYRTSLTCRLAIGYGGSIDQVSGVVPRAPRFWIRLRLEWAFRLCQEPRRLWRRYLPGNLKFVFRVLTRRRGMFVKRSPGIARQLAPLARLGVRRVRQDVLEELYIRTGWDQTRPYAIRGLLTKRCNYRCRYCGDWRRDAAADEMDLDQWQAALLSLKRFIGSYVIQFSGGEPFMFKGFPELLEFCRDNGIGAGMVTNGSSLGTNVMRRVLAAEPTNIDISVDGTGPESHDWARGVPGSFDRLQTGIAGLRSEMDAMNLSIPIRIKTTVHAANYRQLPDLVRWCSEVGASTISFQPVRHWTPEVEQGLWLTEEGDVDALAEVVEQLVDLHARGAPIETPPAVLRTWPDYFRNAQVPPGMWPCRVGMGDYHIQPNGDVYVCWLLDAIGNVRQQEARDVWFSPRARALRRETLSCGNYGHQDCALSCLARRPFRTELQRGLLMLKRTR